MRKGDCVKIIKGPPSKLGKIGIITMLVLNGAMVKLSENQFTLIKFEHLKVIK